MGMTNEQFKAYIEGLRDELLEYQELKNSPNKELQAYAEKKIERIIGRLQEALER